jgi:hypothetical protein
MASSHWGKVTPPGALRNEVHGILKQGQKKCESQVLRVGNNILTLAGKNRRLQD